MNERVTFTRVDGPADGGRVCDYDELPEDARHELPRVLGDDGASIDATAARALEGCEFVKYTEYYSVERSDG